MQAYEEVLTEYWYYDSDEGCKAWTEGSYDQVTVLNFYNYDVEVDYHDFDVDDVPSYEVVVCDTCGDRYTHDVNPLTQFTPGEAVWVCGKCDTWYVNEDDAVECCSDG